MKNSVSTFLFQQVQLYNAYAAWAMCRAGFEVLDVHPLSATFPNGTDSSYHPYDSVHNKDSVSKPTDKILLKNFLALEWWTQSRKKTASWAAELIASTRYAERDPRTYRLSEKEEIVFVIFVVVYISPKDTDMELKLKSVKKQMSSTYSTRANLKVNEDAKNFGIKIKDGSLRMLTKRYLWVYLARSVDFRHPQQRWLSRMGTRLVMRNRQEFGVENDIWWNRILDPSTSGFGNACVSSGKVCAGVAKIWLFGSHSACSLIQPKLFASFISTSSPKSHAASV